MRRLLSLAAICLALPSPGQNLYFPESNYKDSTALNKNMPELARAVIAVYQQQHLKPDANLSRCEILTEQYAAAKNTLDSLPGMGPSLNMATVGAEINNFVYQSYACAKLRQMEERTSFEVAYSATVRQLYDALPGASGLKLSIFTGSNLQGTLNRLQELLDKQSGKDSIPFSVAKLLCSIYNSYRVNAVSFPLLKPLLAGLENEKYDIDDSVLIRTRDGATLSATVIRKKGLQEKQPAIFVFNIYTSQDKVRAIEIALKGYVAVVADTRGKRLSPEDIEPNEHDARDAYDIIDWISKQPWSNGKVGMYGASYLGFAQWAAAKKVHPALKTIIPQAAVGSGIDVPMHNNVFMSYVLKWLHEVTNNKGEDLHEGDNFDHWDSVFNKWYTTGASFRSLDSLEGRPNKIFQRWLMHPSYDDYWKSTAPYKTDFASINIPVLTITGYYDGDQMGALYYFEQHHLFNKQANHYLVIGPYDHGGTESAPDPVLDGYPIDPVADISITELCYHWFDFILRDSVRPAFLKDRINYEVMGANEWKHAPSFNKIDNDTLRFYLSNIRKENRYALTGALPGTPGFIRQQVDLKDRSDTNYTPSSAMIDSSVDVSNGVSFVSAPFKGSFEINGSLTGELKVSINKKDMDLMIRWYELTPDGMYFPLSKIGCLMRASYARDRSRRQLLRPGRIETIPLSSGFFTSKKIGAGSRLVIVLQIHKSREDQINYGTGKDVSDESIADAGIPLELKWYNNSLIKVPVYVVSK